MYTAVRGNFRSTCQGDQCFVAKTIGRLLVASIGNDDVFELGKFAANRKQRNQLVGAGDENDFGFGMFQDISSALRRLLEIDRNSDSAVSVDCKIGGMPF